MEPETFDADVLVVGLGPTGATLSGLLARAGLSVIVVDKAIDLYPMPRAVHFDAEIMRIFQSLGLAQDLRPHIRAAPDYEFRNAQGEVLVRIPTRSETPLGWASSYMFYQPGLERALRHLVANDERIETRLERVFEALEQDAGGVTATVSSPGGNEWIRCRYLVGCDGGPSPVREFCGLTLEDLRFDEPWLVVDVKLGPQSRVPDLNLQFCDPARPTTCVQSGPGRHRWEFMLKPEETPELVLADGFVEALLAPWEPDPGMVIERKAFYRFHGLIAHSWRDRRVLIAGDAAHQMPPMAGQGMCSGIRDAFNLGWKLAAVIQGEATDALLDTYEEERAPHAREVIALAIGLGKVVCATDPAVVAARDTEMLAARAAGTPPPNTSFSPFQQGLVLHGAPGAGEMFPQPVAQVGEGEVRLDDMLGPGAWLIARDGGAEAAAASGDVQVVGLGEPRLAPFAGVVADWLSAYGADAVLVRPDRVVFGAGGDAVAIARSYVQCLAPPIAKAA